MKSVHILSFLQLKAQKHKEEMEAVIQETLNLQRQLEEEEKRMIIN